MGKNIIAMLLGGVALIVIWGLIISLPIMLLWNWCAVPAVPGLVELGWFQAWGIYVLCNLLFKSAAVANKE